jgi:hypothetical protein
MCAFIACKLEDANRLSTQRTETNCKSNDVEIIDQLRASQLHGRGNESLLPRRMQMCLFTLRFLICATEWS